jgi:ankyrin repeat protein
MPAARRAARRTVRASKTGVIDAVKSLDVDAVAAILDADPKLLSATGPGDRTLLHLACAVRTSSAKARDLQVRLAALLLDRGLAIDAPYGRDKCTALFEAVARARNIDLVRFLLKRGADVHTAPGGGLFAAAWWQDLEILDVLLDAGADPEVVVGVTPFLAAWGWKRFDAAKHLARRGADVNYQDRKQRTALHIALEKEFDPSVIEWLVRHGASPDIEDEAGVSARVKASRKRNPKFLAAIDRR